MDRINSDGIIEVEGKRLFTDGDPHAEEASEGTAINAQFLNGVQEEICGFIESQGINLSHEQSNQLSLAVTNQFFSQIEIYRSTINTIIRKLDKNDVELPPMIEKRNL